MSAYPDNLSHTRWCPFVTQSGIGGSYNRPGPKASMTDDVETARCIGNHCAMWRWSSIGQTEPGSIGYCGLAGKP